MRQSRRRAVLCAAAGVLGGLAGCSGRESSAETETVDTETIESRSTATRTSDSSTPTSTPVSQDLGAWPTFQHDRANTGHSPDVAGPKSSVSAKWITETDPGETVRASPIIANETVFVGSGTTVYALTVAEGNERWRTDVDGVVDGAPAIYDDAVFVGSKQGTVYRLAEGDGTVEWRHATGFGNKEHRPASPRVVDDRVYFGTGNGLVSLDASTGGKHWHVLTREETVPFARVHSTPAIGDGAVYVGHPTGVNVLDAEDGSVLWRTMIPPGADGSTTYVSSPAITDDRLFIGARNGSLYVLDRASGERLTTYENEFEPDLPGSPSDEITTSPSIANGTVVAGSEDYHVYAWDVETGNRQWRFRVGGRCYTSPAIADGIVYAGGVSGRVYGLAVDTGEVRWRYDTGGQLLDSSPAVVEGLVCVVNHRGDIVMIEGGT